MNANQEKAKKFLAKTVEANSVAFELGNGQRLVVGLDDMPADIQRRLALHGLSQKVGDAAAGCAGDKAYGAAFAAMSGVVTSLASGKWGVEREAGGLNDLIDAIAQVKKLDRDAVAEAVRKAEEGTVKGWMKNPKISATILEIKAKRAKAVAKEAEEDFTFEV